MGTTARVLNAMLPFVSLMPGEALMPGEQEDKVRNLTPRPGAVKRL